MFTSGKQEKIYVEHFRAHSCSLVSLNGYKMKRNLLSGVLTFLKWSSTFTSDCLSLMWPGVWCCGELNAQRVMVLDVGDIWTIELLLCVY